GAGHYDYHYQANGVDHHVQMTAERQGEHLVVSSIDAADHPRPAAEAARRDRPTREQAPPAEAERQRGELQRVLEQAPFAIAVFR
nr:hypothetical protein [Tanacetum cinerariifolium]